MNKSVRRIACLMLGALTACSFVACGKGKNNSSGEKEQLHDPETRPLVMATDALDGNFNPYFATSATDTNIIGMTQIGMLSTDENGNVAYGVDQPTVVLDYKQTMIGADGNATTVASEAEFTDYEFIIKNGIKFSDGKALTIKDVLFNLYVYLDPVYMGSATIYSTEIVGLKSYRAQDRKMEDASESQIQATFTAKAQARINKVLDYLDDESSVAAEDLAQVQKDIETIKKLFKEEVSTDWTNSVGQLEAYEEKYTFTEDWQVFFYNEGLVKEQPATGGGLQKDENGKYVTTLDLPTNQYAEVMAQETTKEKIDAYIAVNPGATEKIAKENLIKNKAIEMVIGHYTSTGDLMSQVVGYWATGANAREEFVAEEKTKWFSSVSDKVEKIDGITQSTTSKDYSGKDLGASHDVLKIRIYGVDPKAIWNFGFSVSPMHYYSSKDAIDNTLYGVKTGDKAFFDNVLKDPEKTKKPVGAGIYMATSATGQNVTGASFYNNNWVYFERNPYFESLGGSITNANIKYLRYKVVSSDNVIHELDAKDIDYGQPNASKDNMTALSEIKHITSKSYKTNGYGYVGINPKHVPDIEVRQAIMMSMDTLSIIDTYYGGTLADPIYRPMSTTNWAYPKGVGEYYEYTTKEETIKSLVKKAGWIWGEDGKFYKDGKTLKIKFTIAGESKDHPAFAMFEKTAEFLNTKCGFDITVGTDVSALVKLASGDLAVWAAAWSSTIDPDMYQVYHKDSNATSVMNWGYDVILNDTTGKYATEYDIVQKLSELIDQGRDTLVQSERAAIYAQALDKVMELAVELPTYQRNDCVAYNKEVIDSTTLNQNPSAYTGVIDRLWEVNYK